MAEPNTARNRVAHRHLRNWARTFESVGLNGPTRKTMSAIGSVVVSSTIERMEKAIEPDGTPHKPLTPEYVRRKTARRKVTSASGKRRTVKGYSPDIWQRTGDSKRRVGKRNIRRKSVIIVINTPYSGWADSDGRVPRPVLGVSADDIKQIKRLLQEDLRQQMSGGG